MIKIIRKEDTKTSAWSGGTTTQLAICPENGDYGRREFIWRVSSARVEAEESEFTSLPGVARCLMILEGKLWLRHEGHYEMELARLQQDNFDGGWQTLSRGQVTDFNLMVTAGEGRVQVLEAMPDIAMEVSMMPLVKEYAHVSEVFYFLHGGVSVTAIDLGEIPLNAGDVVLIANSEDDCTGGINIVNNSNEKAEIIRAIVYHD